MNQKGSYHFRNPSGGWVRVRLSRSLVEVWSGAGTHTRRVKLTRNEGELLRLMLMATEQGESVTHDQIRSLLGTVASEPGQAVSRLVTKLSNKLEGRNPSLVDRRTTRGHTSLVETVSGRGYRLTRRVFRFSLRGPPLILDHEGHLHGRATLEGLKSIVVYVAPHDEAHTGGGKRLHWYQGIAQLVPDRGAWVLKGRFGNENWMDMKAPFDLGYLDFSVHALALAGEHALGTDTHPAVPEDQFQELLCKPSDSILAVAGPLRVRRMAPKRLGASRLTSPTANQSFMIKDLVMVSWDPQERELSLEVRFEGNAVVQKTKHKAGEPVGPFSREGLYEVKVFHPEESSSKLSVWFEVAGNR